VRNVICVLLMLALASGMAFAQSPERKLSELKSGLAFQGTAVRKLQADDFSNPGMLWVERGEKLWSDAGNPAAKSCASCHGEVRGGMKSVATRYPSLDARLGRVLDLEARINECRVTHQRTAPLAYESDELLGLTALIARQSRGLPMSVVVSGGAQAVLETGRTLYYQRMGQMNLACTHCHEQNWGRTLLAEPVSQGHGAGYPAYRLEWQRIGSLQRRLRACMAGIRAELPAFGSDDLVALELFLAWRAQGLPVEAPAVRR
jgi:sulfur-oxidizing protein SoxA